MKQSTKPTRAELERRIKNAIVFVPKTKDTDEIYFADKGLRLIVTQDHTIIETGFHRHVFDNITSSGMSRAYIYVRRFIEIAKENDCTYKDDNGMTFYSYQKLLNDLKVDKAKEQDYLVALYCDMWFYCIFNPLYAINNDQASSFLVYLNYVCDIAKDSLVLDEKTDGMTNKQFLDKFIERVNELTAGMSVEVIFEKKTDEELMQETVGALTDMEQEQRKTLENGSKD